MGSVRKARRYETGGIAFTEQRLLPWGLDTALTHTLPSCHPSVVPGTSVFFVLVNTVRGTRVGPGVFEELGFKM